MIEVYVRVCLDVCVCVCLYVCMMIYACRYVSNKNLLHFVCLHCLKYSLTVMLAIHNSSIYAPWFVLRRSSHAKYIANDVHGRTCLEIIVILIMPYIYHVSARMESNLSTMPQIDKNVITVSINQFYSNSSLTHE